MKSTHRIYESVRTAKSTASGSYKIYLSSAAGLDYSGVTVSTEKEAKDLVKKWNDEELEGNPYAQYVYRKQ